MDEGKTLGRGVSFPPRIGEDGRMAWSTGADNIREAIRVVLMTEPRERLLLPGFGGGLQSFLFEPNITSTHRLIQERIQQALTRWVPRIQVEAVTVRAASDDPQLALVDIQYRLVATSARDTVNLTLRVGG